MKGCVARLFYSLFFLVPLPCHGKVLTYTRMVGQEKLLTTIQLEETAQGFTLTRQNAQESCKVVADPSGDTQRWEQNLEKARLQIKPLLKRLQS